MSRSFRKNAQLIGAAISLLILLTACQPSLPVTSSPTIAPTTTPLVFQQTYITPISLETATPALPEAYVDAAYLLDAVCYDALRVVADRQIILPSQPDLDQYFNNLNSLGVCEGVMTAPAYDFSSRILVGYIQMGQGCDASFYPDAPALDTQARTLNIRVQFAVTSDCDYEVMGIFLAAIARPPDDYGVTIIFQP